MKLNKEKFMKTEMGRELEETIRTWDKAIDERRKATPGIGNPDQGLGFKYWDNTCRSIGDHPRAVPISHAGTGNCCTPSDPGSQTG